MSKIAFLGLGAMGSRIAARLIEASHTVTVWNRSPSSVSALVALGATSASTPRDAADGAEFVLSTLTDDAASQSVWTTQGSGALAGIVKDAVAVEISTVSPAWIKMLAETVVSTGAKFLEAQLSARCRRRNQGASSSSREARARPSRRPRRFCSLLPEPSIPSAQWGRARR
jgi:3-hydroxyisobutyrate dehydrogenase